MATVDVIVVSVDAEVAYDTGTLERHRREWLILNEAPPPAPPAPRGPFLNILGTWIAAAMAPTGVNTIQPHQGHLVPGGCWISFALESIITHSFPFNPWRKLVVNRFAAFGAMLGNAGHMVVVHIPVITPGVAPLRPNAFDNANLQECYVDILREIMAMPNPPHPRWNQTGRPPPAMAPPVSVAFPLLGADQGWGLDNAADQALQAMTGFFNAPGLAGMARRNFFGNISLVVPPHTRNRETALIRAAWETAYE